MPLLVLMKKLLPIASFLLKAKRKSIKQPSPVGEGGSLWLTDEVFFLNQLFIRRRRTYLRAVTGCALIASIPLGESHTYFPLIQSLHFFTFTYYCKRHCDQTEAMPFCSLLGVATEQMGCKNFVLGSCPSIKAICISQIPCRCGCVGKVCA